MMRSLNEAVAELVGTGLDQRQLALLLEVVTLSTGHSTGQKVDAVAERRRAYDRERKAFHRNSTGKSTGIPPDAGSAISILSSSQISEIQKKEEKKERMRGRKIPPDWKPNVGHIAAGKQLGFTEAQVYEQAEDMRLWAHSNEHRAVARKTNWDMTFLSWLRRNKPTGAVNGATNDTMAAFDRAIAREKMGAGSGDGPLLDLTPAGPRTS